MVGVALIAALLAAAALVLALRSSGDGPPSGPDGAGSPPRAERATSALSPAGALGLEVGVDERQPALVGGAPPPDPALGARRLVDRIAPRWVRLRVSWAGLQPRRGAAPTFDEAGDGCSRGVQPCLPYAGTRAQLRALAERQRAAPDRYRVLLVVSGMPEWAGLPGAPGCGRGDTDASARALAPGREADFGVFLRAVVAEATAQGARVDAISPWNEPNVAYFLDPQRERCAGALADAGVASAEPYARLIRAADAARRAMPTSGTQTRPALVVGELAAADRGRRHLVGADELLRALPPAELCRADAISLHRYVDLVDGAGAAAAPGGVPAAAATAAQAPLDRARAVLDGIPCTARTPLWITETGAGAPSGGAERDRRPAVLRGECRAMGAVLDAWRAGGRVRLAVQYSVREDPAFPVGLYDATLGTAVPSAELWAGWGGARTVGAPGPGVPAACAQQPGDVEVLAGLRPPGGVRDATPER